MGLSEVPSSICTIITTELKLPTAEKSITVANIARTRFRTALAKARNSLDLLEKTNFDKIFEGANKSMSDTKIEDICALIATDKKIAAALDNELQFEDMTKGISAENMTAILDKMKSINEKPATDQTTSSSNIQKNQVAAQGVGSANLIPPVPITNAGLGTNYLDQMIQGNNNLIQSLQLPNSGNLSQIPSYMNVNPQQLYQQLQGNFGLGNTDLSNNPANDAQSSSSKSGLSQSRKRAMMSTTILEDDEENQSSNLETKMIRLETTMSKIDKKLDALDNLKVIIEDAKEAKKLASDASTKVDKLETNFENYKKEIDAKISGAKISDLCPMTEYIHMIQRKEVTARCTSKVLKQLELVATVETIKTNLHDQSKAKGNANSKFVICPTKLKNFINTTMKIPKDKKIQFVTPGRITKRGPKYAILMTFRFLNDVQYILDNRKAFKIDQDSKKNCSIVKPLAESLQKYHSLLAELKRDDVIDHLNVTKAGNLCIGKDENFRTMKDTNEVLYFYKDQSNITKEIIECLNSGLYFVDSLLLLLEVPKRFTKKAAVEDEKVDVMSDEEGIY